MPEPVSGRMSDDDVAPAEGPASALDPVVKRMGVAGGVLVAVILVVTALIVYYGAAGRRVPRTALERDVIVAEQRAAADPKNAEVFAELANVYIAAGRYGDAASAISTLDSMTDRAIVPMLKGDLAMAKGDLKGARDAYREAVAQAKRDRSAELKTLKTSGINPKSAPPSRTEYEALLALGRVELQLKDTAAAIKHIQSALKRDPRAADTLTLLGDAQAAAGQRDAAAKTYRKALKYVPGYRPALSGLERLRGGR